MLWLINQVLIAILNFCGYLATKCMSLNNNLCMVKPMLINLNPIELSYYPFVISLDKCSGSCISVDDLSTKICILSKTKDINVKYLQWSQIKMNLKQWSNILHVILNAHSIVDPAIQVKNGIMINANASVKVIVPAKWIIARILAHVFLRIATFWKKLLMV